MKGKDTMKTAVWMLAVWMAMGVFVQAAAEQSPAVLLQEALYQEETEGNLDKAIELYQQVIEQAADVERVAARATYQLAMCHVKKGENDEAAKYFRQVISQYPKQISTVKKAQSQLDSITPPKPKESVYQQIDTQTISFISNQFSMSAAEAYKNNLQVNGHVYYVDPEGYRYSGGMNAYGNWSGRNITQPVKLTGMTGNDYTFYDTSGADLNVKFRQSENRSNHYEVYWTPEEPLASGQFLYYGWSSNSKQKLAQTPDQAFNLWMQNHFGDPVVETFFLVLPKTVQIIEHATPPSGNEQLLSFNVYWWTKQVPKDEGHTETVKLMLTKDVSPEELAEIVEKAVVTISTCSEADPRVTESLKSLKGLDEAGVVSNLAGYLDEKKATIRRSAVYILWKGGFSDISPALEQLRQLCSHEEEFTRGMAALALGENKDADSYDLLVAMTLEDKSGYARRCGAYALGLLGDPKALEILEKAKKDEDGNVRNNVDTAITMLTKLSEIDTPSPKPDPNLTQESYDDIQPDGTIRFKQPKILTNNGDTPIVDRRFINSDFVELTQITDLDGNPVPFEAKHEGNIYRYHIQFEKPIMPGESFTYVSEGTISGLISPVPDKPNTYRYFMNHSPATGAPTLRIESYLLPEGAEVVSTVDDMEQNTVDGRIELRIEKVIPANGSLLTSFQYTLPTNPKAAEDLTSEGWKLWGQRKLDEAEAKFKEAVRNDPDNENAWQGLGWSQFNQGKNKNAETSFKKCIKLNPNNSAALNGLGWIEHAKDNKDVAIKWWEKAVKASNGIATASLSGLTKVYMEKQDYAKAVKYYEMWLKTEPDNQDAKAGLEKAKAAMK